MAPLVSEAYSPNLSPNTISWQSAFWGLVAIALNSMSQPAGMVCGFPSRYGFFLRGSPFICLFDALYLLSQLCVFGFRDRSSSKALEKVVRHRFQDLDSTEEGSLFSLQNNAPFRITLFMLGALPQVVKIFACSGIPWTQAFGAMYFASFLLIEMLILPAQRDQCPAAGRVQTGSSTILQANDELDEATQVASYIFKVAKISINVDEWVSQLSRNYSYGVVLIFMYPILTHILQDLDSDFSWSGFSIESIFALLMGCYFVMMISVLQRAFLPSSSDPTVFLYWDLAWFAVIVWEAIVFAGWMSVGIGIPFIVILGSCWLCFIWYGDANKRLQRVIGLSAILMIDNWSFLLQNLIVTLLWYRYLYDPANTLKPSWTDQLG